MFRAAVAISLALGLSGTWGCTRPFGRDPGEIASAYASAGRYDDAAREIELAVRTHPRDAALHRQAAGIHERRGDTAQAIGHLEVAIQITPSDAELWIQLGELENSRENIADAYVAFRRATELAPDDVRAVSGLALSADNLGFDEEAEAAYARWTELERTRESSSPARH
ncbi:MAG: tetratricopeptide repeat protein [Myxococcota bacterium]